MKIKQRGNFKVSYMLKTSLYLFKKIGMRGKPFCPESFIKKFVKIFERKLELSFITSKRRKSEQKYKHSKHKMSWSPDVFTKKQKTRFHDFLY